MEVTSIIVAFPDGERKEMPINKARELFAELKKLFGEKVVAVTDRVYIERDRWPRWISQPIITYDATPKYPKLPEVYCVSEK